LSCTAWLFVLPSPLYGLSLFLGLASIVEALGIAALCFSGSDGSRARWPLDRNTAFFWDEGLCLPAFVPCYGLELEPSLVRVLPELQGLLARAHKRKLYP
jgi:hypothetical protein